MDVPLELNTLVALFFNRHTVRVKILISLLAVVFFNHLISSALKTIFGWSRAQLPRLA